jgi:hypothetical protein
MILEKQFTIENDYKKSLLLQQKQTNQTKRGRNKEIFMLNIETFKSFCLKAGTKKADDIHDYFIKLENIMFEITKSLTTNVPYNNYYYKELGNKIKCI